ncbi:UPF0158 family protein [Neobacillus niacini]|uniref:UPF0158 family protein n=1 Tax=Neobacillus niacini TaxID=86668 RepID=UPI0021CAF08B|nr:UPF0158 family protein [Neobacillus niacini]MCM3767745.1 UPF0158 family protein [Neobacillus niacini]
MQRFCYSLSDLKLRNTLLDSISGKDAFRRFKDIVYHLGISGKWYEFRDQQFKEIAIEFCKRKNIDYKE